MLYFPVIILFLFIFSTGSCWHYVAEQSTIKRTFKDVIKVHDKEVIPAHRSGKIYYGEKFVIVDDDRNSYLTDMSIYYRLDIGKAYDIVRIKEFDHDYITEIKKP